MDQGSPKIWTAIELAVSPEAVEAVEFAFNSLDSLGNEIGGFKAEPTSVTKFIGYFEKPPDDEQVQDELHYALRAYGLTMEAVHSIERRTIENADWLAEWKRHWKPTTIGRFVITPPWQDVEDAERFVIKIEPNMAFGTGTHETTQLCLRSIDQNYVAGQSFLDVGTGTGILAIAAAKIVQASKSGVESPGAIVACDNDPDSIKIARENSVLNGVDTLIEFRLGSLSAETPDFDFVCANLTFDIILPVLDLLLEKANRLLFLSGILVTQEEEIIAALNERGISNAEVHQAGEWTAMSISTRQ
jgi:ribosomal protein L11 methyltransferase